VCLRAGRAGAWRVERGDYGYEFVGRTFIDSSYEHVEDMVVRDRKHLSYEASSWRSSLSIPSRESLSQN